MKRILGFAFFLVLLYSVPASACTVFAGHDAISAGLFVAKSYDWHTQAGMVIANMQGIHKRALAFPFTSCPDNSGNTVTTPSVGMSWTSKYRSITFNQYGREFPNGGMNEKGLVVEETELDPGANYWCGTAYTPDGATQATNSNQWEQYILDTFGSVDEFLANPPTFAIVPNTVAIQLLICDSTDQCAIAWIEDNKLHTITGADFSILPLFGTPLIALTNDYYDCSVNGGTNGSSDNYTLALKDYVGFGGTRPESDLGTGGTDYCQNLPVVDKTQTWCDYACRSSNSSWSTSNSVERFIRAAYTLGLVQGDFVNPPLYAQDYINEVYSGGGDYAGTTMWQIIYYPHLSAVQWRTIADGNGPNIGFGGQWRVLSFGDIDWGDGACNTHDDEVVNIDSSPGCGTGPYCNPNPDLPSCPQSDGEEGIPHTYTTPPPPCHNMQPYDPQYNYNLVQFAASQPGVDTEKFKNMVQNAFPSIGDHALDMLYSIWGGYPQGFTACGRDSAPEDIANLYLKSATPYLAPLVQSVAGNHQMTYDKNCDFSIPIDIGKWKLGKVKIGCEISGGFTGLENTQLKSLSVKNDSSTDIFSIEGDIPELKTVGTVKLSLDLPCCLVSEKDCLKNPLGSCPYSVTGTVNVNFPVSDFTVNMDGAHTSYDDMKALCFDNPLTVKSAPFSLGNIDCSVDFDLGILKGQVPLDFCDDFSKDDPLNLISDTINAALDYLGPKVGSDSLPQCGDNLTVEAPAPAPTLTAGWGGLEGQYVTARAGHTYALDGIVNSDQATYSHVFVSFSQVVPGSANPKDVGIVRMTWQKGDNTVETFWTPGAAGDYDLSFDISRSQTDEVTSSVLHVHVLPPEGPTSWLDLTNEGLSSKLKEVK